MGCGEWDLANGVWRMEKMGAVRLTELPARIDFISGMPEPTAVGERCFVTHMERQPNRSPCAIHAVNLGTTPP